MQIRARSSDTEILHATWGSRIDSFVIFRAMSSEANYAQCPGGAWQWHIRASAIVAVYYRQTEA